MDNIYTTIAHLFSLSLCLPSLPDTYHYKHNETEMLGGGFVEEVFVVIFFCFFPASTTTLNLVFSSFSSYSFFDADAVHNYETKTKQFTHTQTLYLT